MTAVTTPQYAPLYQAIAARMIPGRPTYAMGSVIFVWGVSESVASVAGLALIGAGSAGSRSWPAARHASSVTALADGPVGGRSVSARRPLSR